MRTSRLVLIGMVVVAGCASPAPSLAPEPSPLTTPSPQPSPLAATPTSSPSTPGACDVSTSFLHGTWWREIGGPYAFFQWDDGPRPASPYPWLPIVRFDPDAPAGATVSMWAERLDTGQRAPGQLNSRADPRLIYRFSSPAPDLPGGWYLFQQALPSAGCWRLSAAINGRVVGTAVVEIRGSLSSSPEASGAPTPQVAGASLNRR